MASNGQTGGRGMWNWLDARTGFRDLLAPIRRRVLLGGPSWWYSPASCLLWLLLVQMVTGLLLMASYSPSLTTAWASVHFIEQSQAGKYLRGVHYFAAQAMIILFGVHVVRVILAGAFRAPRELIWVSGLFLLPLVLVWTITGNPLSGTVEGMAQIEVEGNIIGSTPVVGPFVRQVLLGGHRPGNLTLTHLYFLHVGLMPLVALALMTLHLTQVYRHGLTPPENGRAGKPCPYWPFQTVRNMVLLIAVMTVISALAVLRGAPLGAPADPVLPNSPRPEWYFLWLFELRRYFSGPWEFVATVIIPGALLLVLLMKPVIDAALSPRAAMALRMVVVVGGLAFWAGLTAASLWRDSVDEEFQAVRRKTHELGQVARQLADEEGIGPEGATSLLANHPPAMGPILFRQKCGSCHSFVSPSGEGIAAEKPSAPNLYGVGKAEWIRGFLDPDRIRSDHYFGGTKFKNGDMAGKLDELFKDAGDDGAKKLQDRLDLVAGALAAEAGRSDARSADDLAEGRKLITGLLDCTSCHKFGDTGELGEAPDLTGYASRKWMRELIRDPKQARFYKGEKNDRMPAFAPDAAHLDKNLMSGRELELIISFLREEERLPDPSSGE